MAQVLVFDLVDSGRGRRALLMNGDERTRRRKSLSMPPSDGKAHVRRNYCRFRQYLGYVGRPCSAFAVFLFLFLTGSASAAPIRALHLPIHAASVQDIELRVKLAAEHRYTHLILGIANGVRFIHYPGPVHPKAWSVTELQGVTKYANSLGLTVVPEVKLLTHQEKFLSDARPELLYNQTTSDPRSEELQRIQLAYLDEVIETLRPPAIHIGHDEVSGFNKGFRKKGLALGESMLPADLFLQSILGLHRELARRGTGVWMWGDMIIERDEASELSPLHMHGDNPGYGKRIRDQLPRDIVVCVAQYIARRDIFPAVAALHREGFQVLGATWRDARTVRIFSSYAAKNGASGMIATTWFHVQRREWATVDEIIRTSGSEFVANFPPR